MILNGNNCNLNCQMCGLDRKDPSYYGISRPKLCFCDCHSLFSLGMLEAFSVVFQKDEKGRPK